MLLNHCNYLGWTPTLVILLLVIGFPITIILSWIFDVTPEGIKKSESIEEEIEQKQPQSPIKRRLKASDRDYCCTGCGCVYTLISKDFLSRINWKILEMMMKNQL